MTMETRPKSFAGTHPAGNARRAGLGSVSSKTPHFSWTAVAGSLFAWNAGALVQGRPFATDFFRRHPVCTVVFVAGLTHHLAPRRSDDRGPLGYLADSALVSVRSCLLRAEEGRLLALALAACRDRRGLVTPG